MTSSTSIPVASPTAPELATPAATPLTMVILPIRRERIVMSVLLLRRMLCRRRRWRGREGESLRVHGGEISVDLQG